MVQILCTSYFIVAAGQDYDRSNITITAHNKKKRTQSRLFLTPKMDASTGGYRRRKSTGTGILSLNNPGSLGEQLVCNEVVSTADGGESVHEAQDHKVSIPHQLPTATGGVNGGRGQLHGGSRTHRVSQTYAFNHSSRPGERGAERRPETAESGARVARRLREKIP